LDGERAQNSKPNDENFKEYLAVEGIEVLTINIMSINDLFDATFVLECRVLPYRRYATCSGNFSQLVFLRGDF